jgi:DNA-damage-inducible protein J
MRYIAVTHEGRSVSKSAMIRARVEPELKDRAEAMLEELGLTATSAITLFYRQIIERRGLPFELRLPNATTQRAMRDARTGRGVVGASSMDELFAKLDAPNRKARRRSRRRKARSSR